MKQIILSPKALEDIAFWKLNNKAILVKVTGLIVEIANNPFTGIGKPDPLKHQLKGKWRRPITDEHRLIYEVDEAEIRVISCRFHYE